MKIMVFTVFIVFSNVFGFVCLFFFSFSNVFGLLVCHSY